MSKRVAEELCEGWTARTGIATVILRPVITLAEEQFARADPTRLDYGAFVHVDDVATAVAQALSAPVEGHVRLILTAAGDVDATRAREVLDWQPKHVVARRRRLRGLRAR